MTQKTRNYTVQELADAWYTDAGARRESWDVLRAFASRAECVDYIDRLYEMPGMAGSTLRTCYRETEITRDHIR